MCPVKFQIHPKMALKGDRNLSEPRVLFYFLLFNTGKVNMWVVFLSLAILAVFVLLFYLLVELNELEKKVVSFSEEINKHYEK
jgi:hypothetical protein